MSSLLPYRYALIVVATLAGVMQATAQSVRIDHLKDQFGKGKAVKMTGGLSANNVYYDGNTGHGRSPFSYFIQGNVNFNLYGLVDLPFSFTLSDFGGNYTYPVPPDRLSFHPAYKSVTTHIGTFSMNYSPYTVNGYLFTGGGVDVEPEGPLKVSAVYGRLQKAVQYDTGNHTVPAAYERWGFGSRIQYQQEKYRAGVIVFRAWDAAESIRNKPDSTGLYPMENTVVSLSGGVKILKQMDLSVEYAASALTRDLRAEPAEGTGLLRHLVNSKESTGFYNAFKSQLQYTLQTTVFGMTYERIDPGYQTLGAYYSNNDLENITLNAAQPLFGSKLRVAFNAGLQRDNLDGRKSGSSRRATGAVNVGFNPTEKITSSASYSNFQTFMRMRPQFQTINQLDEIKRMDTLDYTQVSQQATASAGYTLRQTESLISMFGLDLSLQETADEQGGVIRNGNASQFYNAAVNYSRAQLQKGLTIMAAFNVSYNTIGRNDFTTLGPTAAVAGKMLKKKLTLGTGVSYNASHENGGWNNRVWNTRGNASYNAAKRHQVNLILLHQWRQTPQQSYRGLTVTLSYQFTFT